MVLFPMALTLRNADRLIDGRGLEALLESTRPPNFQRLDAFQFRQAKMLFRWKAAEIASAIDHSVLFPPAGEQLEARADCVAIAPDAGEAHIEIISGQGLRAEYGRR